MLWVNSAGESFVIDGHSVLIDFDDPPLGGAAGPVFVAIDAVSRLETAVCLVKRLHLEIGNPYPGCPDLRCLSHRESQTADDEGVGEGGGRDVDVEASLELGERRPIPKPVPLAVGLEEQRPLAPVVDHSHVGKTGSPSPVELDPEGDRPRCAFLDHHFPAFHPDWVSFVETDQAQALIYVQARPRIRQHQVMVWAGYAEEALDLLPLLGQPHNKGKSVGMQTGRHGQLCTRTPRCLIVV
jgi:hypothetical protein